MAQPASNTRVHIANVFGTLLYIAIVIQWFWSLLILCYPLIQSGALPPFLMQSSTEIPHQSYNFGGFTPVVTMIAIIITIVVMAATFVLIAKLPARIGKRGGELTHTASKTIISAMTHKKPLPKQRRIRLSYRVTLLIKLVCIVIPLISLLFSGPITELSPAIIWTIAGWCAAWSVIWFGTQIIAAWVSKIPRDLVW